MGMRLFGSSFGRCEAETSRGLFKAWSVGSFLLPTEDIRNIFQADFVIWMNTKEKGRFEDTNKIFEKPSKFNLEINSFDYNIKDIITKIKEEYESI